MADQEKMSLPWNDGKLNAIVADYFAMLESELRGLPTSSWRVQVQGRIRSRQATTT